MNDHKKVQMFFPNYSEKISTVFIKSKGITDANMTGASLCLSLDYFSHGIS